MENGSPTDDKRFRIGAAVVTVNVLTSAGFSLAGVFTAPAHAYVASLYAAARSLPLAAVTLWLVARRGAAGLRAIALVMGIVQALDALIGLVQHDVGKTVGPAVFAVATFACLPLFEREN